MPSPTEYLIDHLRSLHVDAARSGETDPVVAAAEAADICSRENANGVVIGRLTLSRTDKFQAPIGVANYFVRNSSVGERNVAGAATGVVSFSGILQRTAIQAELHLYYVDCNGKVRWKMRKVVGETHHGTNIGSGFTEIVERAIDEAVADLALSQAGGS